MGRGASRSRSVDHREKHPGSGGSGEADLRTAATEAEANRLKQENEAQRLASRTALDGAAKQRAQLDAEAALRTTLLAWFNAILQTQDTTRGLIVNMSDVLFDTGK